MKVVKPNKMKLQMSKINNVRKKNIFHIYNIIILEKRR